MQRVEGTNELHLLEHYHPIHNFTPNHAHNHNHNHHYHPDDLLLLQQQQEQQRHHHLLQLNASFPPPPMFNTSSCFPLSQTTHSYNYNNNYGVSGKEEKPECGSSEYEEETPHPTEPLSSTAQLEAATAVGQEKRKGKRKEAGREMDRTEKREREKVSSSSPPAAKLLEELAKRLMEQQEALHQKLMEKVEKQEEERAQREEAYLRREEARSKREHDRKAEEYTIATERDAAILAFLHMLTSQNPVDSPLVNPSTTEHYYMNRKDYAGTRLDPSNSKELEEEGGEREIERERGRDEREKERENSDHSHARRWPKVEVHGLIRVRSGMEPRFQEAGPKAHLWEEVSNALAGMGFERSAKRCKEKWENINKYFRKTKDNCRKRPDNAKTCPYFHQLELLYNRGILSPPILAPTNTTTTSTTNTNTITSTKPSNKTIPTSFYLNNNIIINNNNNNNDSIYPRHEISSEGLVADILMHQKLLDHEYLDVERVPEQLLIRGQQERRIQPLSSSKLESVSFMNLLHSAPLQNQDFHM